MQISNFVTFVVKVLHYFTQFSIILIGARAIASYLPKIFFCNDGSSRNVCAFAYFYRRYQY